MASGLARSGFDIDLLTGEAAENRLREIFDAGAPLLEVKSDEKSRETGRLFIEYRQKGRDSGISVTEADWWAFETYPSVYIILPTARLREAARRAYRDASRRKRGGDFDNYEGVLVPIEWIVPTERGRAA